jgi:hypothetical protein
MITVPLNTASQIQIPAKTESKNERTESIERIGVSVAVAAEMIGVCERTVWKLAKAGKIHSIRLGTRCIFSVQSLREFVDEKKATCNSVDNSAESPNEDV